MCSKAVNKNKLSGIRHNDDNNNSQSKKQEFVELNISTIKIFYNFLETPSILE